MQRMQARGLLGGVALLSLGALCAALATQIFWGMQPCPWCVLQRLVFLVIAVVAIVGRWLPVPVARRAAALLCLLLGAAGMAAALWQQLVASKSASCDLTLADRIIEATTLDRLWPTVFSATANCADASVPLLGLPYALWSLAGFALVAALSLRALRQR